MKIDSRPKLSPEEFAKVKQIYRDLPPAMRKVGIAAEAALDRLLDKGKSFGEADDIVVLVLKSSAEAIYKRKYKDVIGVLELIGR